MAPKTFTLTENKLDDAVYLEFMGQRDDYYAGCIRNLEVNDLPRPPGLSFLNFPNSTPSRIGHLQKRRLQRLPKDGLFLERLDHDEKKLFYKVSLLNQLRDALKGEGLAPADLLYVAESYFSERHDRYAQSGNPFAVNRLTDIVEYKGKFAAHDKDTETFFQRAEEDDEARFYGVGRTSMALAYASLKLEKDFRTLIMGIDDSAALASDLLLKLSRYGLEEEEGVNPAVFVYSRPLFEEVTVQGSDSGGRLLWFGEKLYAAKSLEVMPQALLALALVSSEGLGL